VPSGQLSIDSNRARIPPWAEGVTGSNPVAPTNVFKRLRTPVCDPLLPAQVRCPERPRQYWDPAARRMRRLSTILSTVFFQRFRKLLTSLAFGAVAHLPVRVSAGLFMAGVSSGLPRIEGPRFMRVPACAGARALYLGSA
jgi:hypothetical protein